jgi:hypothetical protein
MKCEECGKRFSDQTGREYIQLIGGGYEDVCKACADRLAWNRDNDDEDQE